MLSFTLLFINILIDPFATNNFFDIRGFNHNKPEAKHHDVLVKLFEVYRLNPEVATLGNSRTRYGLNIKDARWNNDRIYNFGVEGAGIDEVHYLLEHVAAKGKLKKVIISIDFGSFNAGDIMKGMENFNYSLLSYPGDWNPFREQKAMLEIAASIDTLEASLETVKFNIYNKNKNIEILPSAIISKNDYRNRFLQTEYGFLVSNARNVIFRNNFRGSMFDHFRKIIKFCYKHNIDARFIISPTHAWQSEIENVVGLQPQFMYWKRKLVNILVEESNSSGKSPFHLWDFSGYNSITTEKVPICGSNNIMTNYFDPSHYKPVVGLLVLERVLDQNINDVPKDFGVELTSKNIEGNLEKNSRDREQWRIDHPEDYKQIVQLKKLFSKPDTPYFSLCRRP
jgi:hypothetical protein